MHLQESSISLIFPDEKFFRICDCKHYKSLNNIREVDICWYDEKENNLFLIELKNWDNSSISEESDITKSPEEIVEIKKGIANHRLKILLEKSIDSMCIFSSILLQRDLGQKFKECSPFFGINLDTTIILLSIINWNEEDTSYVANINTKYKSIFQSYAKLFGASKYLVLTKKQAMKKFEWIKG